MDLVCFVFFFFNDTATTEIYTLSLHDALPIWWRDGVHIFHCRGSERTEAPHLGVVRLGARSEEHTSELQSPCNLVCRLLLEKKKKNSPQHLLSHKLTHAIPPRCIPDTTHVYDR